MIARSACERLGTRVRTARKSQGLTLEQLERKCGVHRTTLGRLERGDTHVSFAVVLAVLEALGELADIELLLARPDVPRHRRTPPPIKLDTDF